MVGFVFSFGSVVAFFIYLDLLQVFFHFLVRQNIVDNGAFIRIISIDSSPSSYFCINVEGFDISGCLGVL